MGVLNSWQKIDRVLPGFPFGNGSDGAYSSATIPTLKYKSCSGSASSTTLTADTDVDPFSVGDIVGIYQNRGTGVGQWEVNRISSVGSDQYTLQTALYYTYTDSVASQAQVVKIPQYTTVTVESGTWTITAWDENTGGILPIAVKNDLSIVGSVVGTAKGYNYGPSGTRTTNQASATGYSGEGPPADSSQTTTANGISGGAGQGGDPGRGGGGGAGHASSGSAGQSSGTSSGGGAGSTDGSADLTDMVFGGTGGTGGANNGGGDGDYGGLGGRGGGIIMFYAKNVSGISGSIVNNGDNGQNKSEGGGGGGGAGGSVLIVCQTATLGTNKITVASGSGGVSTSQGDGGNGAVGRIAVHHSGTVTGTTSPTFTDVSDPTLIETHAGLLMNFI